MAIELTVPAVGESISAGTIARWLKKDGDAVRADEPVYELETEKATIEIAAPAAGTLHITVAEGQTVPIGAAVGRIEPGPGARSAPEPAGKQRAEAKPAEFDAAGRDQHSAPVQPLAEKPALPRAEPKTVTTGDGAAMPAAQPMALSPAARRLADEQGVDVRRLAGTGRAGRVTKEDVLTYLEQQARSGVRQEPSAVEKAEAASQEQAPPSSEPTSETTPKPPPTTVAPAPQPSGASPRETRQRMSAIRQRIAERLVAAQNNAAILTTFNEADMSAVMALRAKYQDVFREKYGVGLGFMSFFVKASVQALQAFPIVNARIDGSDIVYQHVFNIGVAVSTEKGLMVPVLQDADRLSFAEIEQQVAEMAQKARAGKITVADLQGGTFTITNGGVYGSLLSTPILNPPQTAILGMHTIQKRPVAVNDQIVIRPMMYLALSYDHRLLDGREAVQFLIRIKECIESPERLFLQV